MDALEQQARFPTRRDIRLNLQAVLREAARVRTGRARGVRRRGAAALMAMNNVYYRSATWSASRSTARSRPAPDEPPMQPATNRTDFELMALAVSAINGCEMCVRAHEKTVTEGGLTPDHVNDAVRIAATIYAAAVALEAGAEAPALETSAQGV